MPRHKSPKKKSRFFFNRINFLITASIIMAAVIGAKLAYLQVWQYSKYSTIAKREHLGETELPARRGEILTQDYHSGELFKLATNITLDLVYADPTRIQDKDLVARTIAPLLFDVQEEIVYDQTRVKEELKNATTDADRQKIKLKNQPELLDSYINRLKDLLSQELRPKILLEKNISPENAEAIKALNLPGISVFNNELWAAPKDINNIDKTAKSLSQYIDIHLDDLKNILIGRNRYVILKKKISPEISQKIKALIKNDKTKNFLGIGLKENYYRFYPEKSLSAQVLGFVDHQNTGRYGIEEAFENKLKGAMGIFSSQRDASGKQITVGDSVIRPAVDGDNVILTIDRAIQMEVEKKLAKTVESTRADSGQVVIMEPSTGRIIAMANYPSFDPNEYGRVFDKEEITLSDDEKSRLVPADGEDLKNAKHFILPIDPEHNLKMEVFKEDDVDGNITFYKYKNKVGPKVYRNSVVADIYEPGSVFKTIAMASAINDHDVKPGTTVNASGPIKVDLKKDGTYDFEIHNAQDKYRGVITMTQALQYSDNIGMCFVARKLGRTLFYNYIKNFGFGERTDIEFTDELAGQIEYPSDWSESELLTHAFGQGVAVTPIQIVTALSAIANQGVLMQPYIVDHLEGENTLPLLKSSANVILNKGKNIIKTEPKIIRRVITKDTADTITSMMVTAVENGVAPQARLEHYYIAGKTGTSQIYKNGKALEGTGNTITSIGGFGPIDQPRFAILIKFDHPRTDYWGSSTVAPLFREIAEYLYSYYNIPPDK